MKVDFSPPEISEEDIAAVSEVLRSGWITSGPRVKQFEAAIAEWCGTPRAVALSSATAAMQCALALLDIGPGDEVITSAYTYTASASVICHVGAMPVIVDVMPGSYLIDPEAVAAAINERTKAVIAVDIGGVMCDYEALAAALSAPRVRRFYAPREGTLQEVFTRVPIIADAAHSFGSSLRGVPSGAAADFSAFSFHAVKNLTTAEGGALTWRGDLGVEDLAAASGASAPGGAAAGGPAPAPGAPAAGTPAPGALAAGAPAAGAPAAGAIDIAEIAPGANRPVLATPPAAPAASAAPTAPAAPPAPAASPAPPEAPASDPDGLGELIYQRAKLYSLHGQTKDALAKSEAGSWEYDIVAPLYKCNMTDIAAALGLSQLKRYEQTLARRRQLARLYSEQLLSTAQLGSYQLDILIHDDGAGSLSNAHLMMVRLLGQGDGFRRRLIEGLARRGVSANVHFKPLPLLSAYAAMGFDISAYPNAWAQYENQVSLPMHTLLSDEDVAYVCASFAEAYAECL